eukprot:1861352-Pleurochrysis_carterae.AAC.1
MRRKPCDLLAKIGIRTKFCTAESGRHLWHARHRPSAHCLGKPEIAQHLVLQAEPSEQRERRKRLFRFSLAAHA